MGVPWIDPDETVIDRYGERHVVAAGTATTECGQVIDPDYWHRGPWRDDEYVCAICLDVATDGDVSYR